MPVIHGCSCDNFAVGLVHFSLGPLLLFRLAVPLSLSSNVSLPAVRWVARVCHCLIRDEATMSAMQQKERHKGGGTAENVAVYPQFMPRHCGLFCGFEILPQA